MPNYGAVNKAWWWYPGATIQNVVDVMEGRASGNFQADGIKKRLVDIDVEKSGRLTIILNEWEPGYAQWWGRGARTQDLEAAIDGKASGDFQADGIKKRLVDLKPQRDGRFTYILEPWDPSKVGWYWFPSITESDLLKSARDNNARIICLKQTYITFPLPSNNPSPDHFAAILVVNN